MEEILRKYPLHGKNSTKIKRKRPSKEPQKNAKAGKSCSPSKSKGRGYLGNNYDPSKAWVCYDYQQLGNTRGLFECTKKPSTGGPPKGIARIRMGVKIVPEDSRGYTEVTLVSVDVVETELLDTWPPGTEKYRQWPRINGVEVKALRDTGASISMIMPKLVSPEKIIPNEVHQILNSDNEIKSHPIAIVDFKC